MTLPSCFKAYDVRGRVPDELNEDLAYNIGRAYVVFTGAESVCIGYDMRESSQPLVAALARGINDQGADVYDIGLSGTEEVYYATFSQHYGGGIMVTASHNPPEYNGLKMVREEARPISADTGLQDIGQLAVAGQFEDAAKTGAYHHVNFREQYAEFLLQQVDVSKLKPFKVVVNAGNGCGGLVLDAVEKALPFEFIKLQHEPDGSFPNGVPNPLLPENRKITADAVREHDADFAVAWDGDFDRCFLFDETGGFIEGYYLVGLIAETLLKKFPGEKIVHDPRLVWNTVETVEAAGGKIVQSKSGHAFMKQVMRDHDAIYGGEMSAHHYFRDFAYCDNGNMPWMLIAELMSVSGKKLSTLIEECTAAYPVSGEINTKLNDADAAIAAVKAKYVDDAVAEDYTDGVGIDYPNWRFNIRKSNTEPLLRLNVESRADTALMEEKTADILEILKAY